MRPFLRGADLIVGSLLWPHLTVRRCSPTLWETSRNEIQMQRHIPALVKSTMPIEKLSTSPGHSPLHCELFRLGTVKWNPHSVSCTSSALLAGKKKKRRLCQMWHWPILWNVISQFHVSVIMEVSSRNVPVGETSSVFCCEWVQPANRRHTVHGKEEFSWHH